MTRPVVIAFAAAALAAVLAAVAFATDKHRQPRRVVGHGQVRFCIRGVCAGPEAWAFFSGRNRRGWQAEHTRRLRLQRENARLHQQLRRVRTLQAHRAYWATRQDDGSVDARTVIRQVFGAYGEQAVRVAGCETGGTFSTTAQNGQYLGIFQMGSSERATYGHGSTPLEQARAAYRYFAATGYDWSPWECKP